MDSTDRSHPIVSNSTPEKWCVLLSGVLLLFGVLLCVAACCSDECHLLTVGSVLHEIN